MVNEARVDVINVLSYFVQHYNTIILRKLDNEDIGHTMNEGHMKAPEWNFKILILEVSARGTNPRPQACGHSE